MAAYNIREAKEQDCEDILRMITELAVYEKMADQVQITAEDLKRDAFGATPFFHAYVAELTTEGSEGGRLVGYVMYYYTYSPWSGRTCAMEDFYVEEKWRKHGIGSALWATVVQRAKAMNCSYVHWVVVDWNKPTIDYYKRHGVRDMTEEEGWIMFRMDMDAMNKLLAQTFPSSAAKLSSNHAKFPSLPSNDSKLPSNHEKLPSNHANLPSNHAKLPSTTAKLSNTIA